MKKQLFSIPVVQATSRVCNTEQTDADEKLSKLIELFDSGLARKLEKKTIDSVGESLPFDFLETSSIRRFR